MGEISTTQSFKQWPWLRFSATLGRFYPLSPQRNQTVAISALLTRRPMASACLLVAISLPWQYFSVILFYRHTKNVSCMIAMLGVELESSEIELTMASGLEVPLLFYFVLLCLSHNWCYWDLGLLVMLEGKKSQVTGSQGKFCLLSWALIHHWLSEPFVSDYKAYHRNPYFLAEHQGVQVSLLLETVMIFLL